MFQMKVLMFFSLHCILNQENNLFTMTSDIRSFSIELLFFVIFGSKERVKEKQRVTKLFDCNNSKDKENVDNNSTYFVSL